MKAWDWVPSRKKQGSKEQTKLSTGKCDKRMKEVKKSQGGDLIKAEPPDGLNLEKRKNYWSGVGGKIEQRRRPTDVRVVKEKPA